METWLKSAAQRMLLDFEIATSISHPVTKGTARETSIVTNFLEPYLPSRYSISSGILIDADDKPSQEQDIVVFDQLDSPTLADLKSKRLFFPESVYSTIEVKSSLTNKTLKDIVAKSASVWALRQSPYPELPFISNIRITPTESTILCCGFCFKSDLSLEDVHGKLREARSEVENGLAISMLCVLKAKKGETGLVVNVSESNLSTIQIIPSHTSRLGIIRCQEPGDTLLHFYFVLMEHLRMRSIVRPGPDLLAYAKLLGLNLSNLMIPLSETKGAKIKVDSDTIDVDISSRFRELSVRIQQGSATDQDILDWLFYLPQTGFSSSAAAIDQRALFTINSKTLDSPTPLDVYKALLRSRQNQATSEDVELLNWFVNIVKSRTPMAMGYRSKKNSTRT